MNSTDLQINDWVYLSEKTKYPMQVTEIDKYNCLLDIKGNEGDPFDGIYGEDGIAPIPLTDEMLESNGFYVTWETLGLKKVHLDHKGYFAPESDISMTCNKTRGYGIVIGHNSIYFKYVNELQHLLRFCGFDDMADNFKIK